MALIAFCAIALVENVTNAHPVTREGGQREGGMEGEWEGGQKGRRRREDKKEQKQDKRVGHVVVIKTQNRD